MTAGRSDKATLVSVFDGRCCIGFILRRGRAGFEAFNSDQDTIGIFCSEAEAAAALWHRARAQLADQDGTP
jgi:hypothetical protein